MFQEKGRKEIAIMVGFQLGAILHLRGQLQCVKTVLIVITGSGMGVENANE